jgi:predicted AlkP superfamily pyrophosphatase or phosphodiesterase
MKFTIQKSIAIFFFLIWNFSLLFSQAFKTEYVIILIIDGPRYSETFGDTSCKYIPKMGKELVKQGVLYSNFRNNGPTYTNSGHTAITTGVYQSISNGGKQLPKNPNIFQYYLKEKGRDKTDAYIISSKGKLEVLANTKNKKWWNSYMPMTYCGVKGQSTEYSPDPPTMNKVYETLGENPPHLMLINLLAVDSYGHSNNWPQYLASIQKCDSYADELWGFIQNHPKLKDKTALLITNDHGRHLDGHKDGFVNHGDKCEGCKHISLLALGPDFKRNQVISTEGELIDISKTISHILKFQMPSSRGRILNELFQEVK